MISRRRLKFLRFISQPSITNQQFYETTAVDLIFPSHVTTVEKYAAILTPCQLAAQCLSKVKLNNDTKVGLDPCNQPNIEEK